ncbi:MAG: AbrB/MazE/SpoVT family DNA-binding domain-containing protein [Anaerolineales bacterium]|nr:AbrB/MazE/SpoVT family DNA-binding domain-containing protein [Anaerolineales bacterium]
MNNVVKTRIVRIGNSKGIRLPKLFLEQTHLGEEVELEMQENQIVIRSAENPRTGWEAQFKAMAANADDQLLDAGTQSSFDEEEWEW